MLAIAAQIPAAEIGGEYFQETHPQELFRECSVYCELVSVPEQLPRMLRWPCARLSPAAAWRARDPWRGVPGRARRGSPSRSGKAVGQCGRTTALAAAADVLNDASRWRSWPGPAVRARTTALALAEALKAPVVHALRGKEFVEYDNPYNVGMTGLIGYSSGYRAMEHCDALLMLGTDFPYRQFYPEGVPVDPGRHARRADRPPRSGRVPLVGTVKDTAEALLPMLTQPRPTPATWTG